MAEVPTVPSLSLAADAEGDVKTANPTETSQLIPKSSDVPVGKQALLKPIHSVLLCGFLVSLSFSVTQVPLLYVFRLMTCEAYYDKHTAPPPGHAKQDRCSVPAIEASTARAISLLGGTTTFFGVVNLFITGSAIKRFGVKSALAFQVFWPAARLLIQNIGVRVGGSTGIIIVQCSQVITIIGGPTGYLLALNTYVTEVTAPAERTGYLGILQGNNMFGSAVGNLIGGILAEVFNITTPFEVTLGLFLASTVYVVVFLPWIPPHPSESSSKKHQNYIIRALSPLKSILPAKRILRDGRVKTENGALILAVGVFLTVLATSYIPTFLQMYSTDIFGFGTRRNSYLVSSYSFLRGMFLIFAFPRIISLGRSVMENQARRSRLSPQISNEEQNDLISSDQEEQQAFLPSQPKQIPEQETFEFDLIYTRFSVLVDGTLTLGAAFVQQGWQMYVIGAILPLGAGTSSAAKGTILQMCPPSQRTDALSSISLVEMIARLATTFVFGLIFAAFASIGKTYLVFFCNAGVALLGFIILLFCRFPPEGSRRLDKIGSEDQETE